MPKIMRLVIVLLAAALFTVNVSYSAEKEVLLKTTSTWDKSEYKKLKIKRPEVTVLKIVLNSGEVLPIHKHDLINAAYVKKGTLTVVSEKKKEVTIYEGEVLPELVGSYHYGKNTGKEPVELIVFYIGEKGTPLSVDK